MLVVDGAVMLYHMTTLNHHIPRVLCHKKLQPDNSFSRIEAMSVDDVWDLLKELNLLGLVDEHA